MVFLWTKLRKVDGNTWEALLAGKVVGRGRTIKEATSAVEKKAKRAVRARQTRANEKAKRAGTEGR